MVAHREHQHAHIQYPDRRFRNHAFLFIESVHEAGLKLDEPLHVSVGDYNPITILKAFKEAK